MYSHTHNENTEENLLLDCNQRSMAQLGTASKQHVITSLIVYSQTSFLYLNQKKKKTVFI